MAMQRKDKESSIAGLLQERFRQLQREKEMRRTRQQSSFLISNNTTTTTTAFVSSSSSSDDHSELDNNYPHRKIYNNNDHFNLLFSDDVHRPELSLSLWPGGSSASDYKLYSSSTHGQENMGGLSFSGWDAKCNHSRVSDVDTSLHL